MLSLRTAVLGCCFLSLSGCEFAAPFERAITVVAAVVAAALVDAGLDRHPFDLSLTVQEDDEAHPADPVLGALPAGVPRETLIAAKTPEGYRHDIHLQGPRETVFFSV